MGGDLGIGRRGVHVLLELASALGVVAVLACAGSDNFLADDAPRSDEIHRVLLVPIDFDGVPGPEYRSGASALEERVASYLQSTGRTVERVSEAEAAYQWRQITAGRGKPGEGASADDPALSRAELARRLAAGHPSNVVVLPELLIRRGNFIGQLLLWDGVSRRVPIHAESDSMIEVATISGEGMGTTLHLTILLPDGTRIFERYVGLEPILEWHMAGFGSTRGGSIMGSPRRDLSRDPQLLAGAVVQGFEPLLEPPRSLPEATAAAK